MPTPRSNLPFQNTLFSFKQWLSALGYAQKTCYGMPLSINDMLIYLQKDGLAKISDITNEKITSYYSFLKKRKNKRSQKLLSPNTLNKELQALHKFSEYLILNNLSNEAPLHIQREVKAEIEIDILSIKEIKALFNVTYQPQSNKLDLALNLRDRAMLAVFYSCALRRNEGFHLNVEDVFQERNLLYVKHGKLNSERMVPFTQTTKQHFLDYLTYGRPVLCKDPRQKAFFLNYRSRRMKGQSFLLSVKKLINKSNFPSLKSKKIGVHTLRHSIASHLLENGMELQKIAHFLGHRSIESTQIYTHLIHEQIPKITYKDEHF